MKTDRTKICFRAASHHKVGSSSQETLSHNLHQQLRESSQCILPSMSKQDGEGSTASQGLGHGERQLNVSPGKETWYLNVTRDFNMRGVHYT